LGSRETVFFEERNNRLRFVWGIQKLTGLEADTAELIGDNPHEFLRYDRK
jgi:hypothetical protein